MKISQFTLIANVAESDGALSRQEIGLAKRFIKSRLKILYPQLRGDPAALERAYEKLDLAVEEVETDTGVIIYELSAPDDPD